MTDMRHMDFLHRVTDEDIRELQRKEATYRGSWKKRGGVGVFMMMARKWDRIEGMLSSTRAHEDQGGVCRTAQKYDVFEEITFDSNTGADGSLLAEIRDLRRYLLLIEAEMYARDVLGGSENLIAPRIHRQRLDDGLTEKQIEDISDYMPVVTSSGTMFIVNRDKVPEEKWEHLSRLAPELNDKEYCELPPEYHTLYKWKGGLNHWGMLPQYRKHWSKQ